MSSQRQKIRHDMRVGWIGGVPIGWLGRYDLEDHVSVLADVPAQVMNGVVTPIDTGPANAPS